MSAVTPAVGSQATAAGGSRLRALAPQLAAAVAAALLAGQLALLLWTVLPGGRSAGRVAPPAPAASGTGAADLGNVLAAHLFGAAGAAPSSGADAPRTNVPLILAGTLAVRDPAQGLAIIGETAQNGHVYAVGAVLSGGVRLHEVYPDRVVLDRGGVLEVLPLPRQFAGGANGLVSRPGNSAEPGLGDSVQRLIARGPELVGEIMRPMPAYQNGQLRGFTVYPGRDRTKFNRLGLQPRDVVTAINNVPLTDPQRGMEILRTLGSAGTAQVTVERGGQTQTVTIDAATVAELSQPEAPAPGAAALAPGAGAEPQNQN